jgi:hypothetical protein
MRIAVVIDVALSRRSCESREIAATQTESGFGFRRHYRIEPWTARMAGVTEATRGC